jgi:predicted transcriptional regulator
MGRSTATTTAADEASLDASIESPLEAPAGDEADDAWAESLRDVLRQVIASLPDHATLGELVDAAKGNPAISPVLDLFTVRELIETAKKKPKAAPKPKSGAEAMPAPEMDVGPKVIRRRADVPDGDLRVLRSLSSQGPLKESDLVSSTELTSEQLRIIVRHLRTKGYIHIEGSGAKRRVKITRNGGGFLRRSGG